MIRILRGKIPKGERGYPKGGKMHSAGTDSAFEERSRVHGKKNLQ